MAADSTSSPRAYTMSRSWNVPNQLSAARIVLALLCFIAIGMEWFLAGLVLFLLAAATDWLDGYLARRWAQVTQLGRILDPFADKIVICGAFILLGAVPGSLVPAWVAVVVTGRELLVTALRGICEGKNINFSARWAGKWKMVLQCLTVGLSLWRLSQDPMTGSPAWFDSLLIGVVWITLFVTLYSGWEYVRLAMALLRDEKV